jgi:hypothetical protein
MEQTKPNTVPSRADRFAEAIDQCEKAMASGDDAAIRAAVAEVGRVAWCLAPQIESALSAREIYSRQNA